MKTIIYTTILACALAAEAQTDSLTGDKAASVKEEKQAQLNLSLYKAFGNYAGWWNALSDQAKDSFIDGYTTAMKRANSVTAGFGDRGVDKLTPGGNCYWEQVEGVGVLKFVAKEFDYKQTPVTSLKDALNEFYKDKLNMRIPDDLALEHIRDQLENRKTAGQLLDELNHWREVLHAEPEKKN